MQMGLVSPQTANWSSRKANRKAGLIAKNEESTKDKKKKKVILKARWVSRLSLVAKIKV